MEKSNEDLISEINELKLKCSELEKKYSEEVERHSKTEEELRLKMMFLEGIANSTIDGFLVVNPYGQKVLQNQRTVELWKIPKEVVEDPNGLKQVQHVMYMTVNPQQFIAEIDYLREHPNDRSRDELELIDGTVLDRYSSPVIGPDGINYGRIWTFHDVTERKKLEKQLLQLNSDKDRFISLLAHDLRGPFNSLLGFSGLLKKNLRTYEIEKIEKMVDLINLTAVKTHELLEDTLLWASIQSKKITFFPSPTNVYDVIFDVVEILGASAQSKNVTIKNLVERGLEITADVFMLKAILRNLISNAIKFSNVGGSIEVSAMNIASETLFRVTDNGVGIKPEVLEKLFNSRSTQSAKGTDNEVGTGFGLLLCKEFVEKHGGKIWIDSQLGHGTTVNFSVPFAIQ